MPGKTQFNQTFLRIITAGLLGAVASGPALLSAQARPTPPAPPVPAPALSNRDLAVEQDELIKLLRLSPTLTTVVEHDPSLLANQEYVNRNNPQLGQYLASHPEIARNPEFYLFTHLDSEGGREQALERAVWPDFTRPYQPPPASEQIIESLIPLVIFVGVVLALLWLTRLFLENRRWSKIFRLQTDVHGKLIEKFGSNQDLLTYMGTDAGKRFLEASPIAVGFEDDKRVPNAVARVLNPLQIGVVLTLLGIGMLAIRHSLGRDMAEPMLLMGTVVLMPGVGFILSAGITWLLAERLGLMPESAGTGDRHDASYNSREQR
jgi:hypothetical protein